MENDQDNNDFEVIDEAEEEVKFVPGWVKREDEDEVSNKGLFSYAVIFNLYLPKVYRAEANGPTASLNFVTMRINQLQPRLGHMINFKKR